MKKLPVLCLLVMLSILAPNALAQTTPAISWQEVPFERASQTGQPPQGSGQPSPR